MHSLTIMAAAAEDVLRLALGVRMCLAHPSATSENSSLAFSHHAACTICFVVVSWLHSFELGLPGPD